MRLRISAAAQADLRAIGIYTAERWGVAQRGYYLARISATLQDLAAGRAVTVPRDEVASGLASFRVGRHVVFLRRSDDIIEIVRVLHTSMDVAQHGIR